jgi:hypothetical protein
MASGKQKVNREHLKDGDKFRHEFFDKISGGSKRSWYLDTIGEELAASRDQVDLQISQRH